MRPEVVRETIVVDRRIDLKAKIYQAAPGLTKPMFHLRGSGFLTSSNGRAIIDGNMTAQGFTMDTTCAGAAITNLRVQNTTGDHFKGGNRVKQTGGRNLLLNTDFDNCGPLQVMGMNHTWNDVAFNNSPGVALHIGLLALPWDKPDENFVNGLVATNIRFTNCGNAWTAGFDSGVLYAGRNLTGSAKFYKLSFTGNRGVSLYIDDLASNIEADDVEFTNNAGRDFLFGGGKRLALTNARSTGAGLPSVWDNRGSKDGAIGNGVWHSYFHNGEDWFHKPLSGKGEGLAGRKFQNDYQAITAIGAEAWLAANPNYLADWKNEENWNTSGRLEYKGLAPIVAAGVEQ